MTITSEDIDAVTITNGTAVPFKNEDHSWLTSVDMAPRIHGGQDPSISSVFDAVRLFASGTFLADPAEVVKDVVGIHRKPPRPIANTGFFVARLDDLGFLSVAGIGNTACYLVRGGEVTLVNEVQDRGSLLEQRLGKPTQELEASDLGRLKERTFSGSTGLIASLETAGRWIYSQMGGGVITKDAGAPYAVQVELFEKVRGILGDANAYQEEPGPELRDLYFTIAANVFGPICKGIPSQLPINNYLLQPTNGFALVELDTNPGIPVGTYHPDVLAVPGEENILVDGDNGKELFLEKDDRVVILPGFVVMNLYAQAEKSPDQMGVYGAMHRIAGERMSHLLAQHGAKGALEKASAGLPEAKQQDAYVIEVS